MENNQRPSKCKHYETLNFLDGLIDDFPYCKCPNKEGYMCIWEKEFRTFCPYYQFQEKKYNGKI